MKENLILEKSYALALSVIALCGELERRREYNLSRQLFRSGTSIGANVEEAQAAQSRADFISKMAIAAKEAREARYWLRLLRDSVLLPPADRARLANPMLDGIDEIVRLLTAIVKTAGS